MVLQEITVQGNNFDTVADALDYCDTHGLGFEEIKVSTMYVEFAY